MAPCREAGASDVSGTDPHKVQSSTPSWGPGAGSMDGGCKPIPEMSEEKTRLGRGGGVGLAPSPASLQQVHITQKVGGGGACSLWGAPGGHPGRAHAGRPWRGPRGPEARLSPLTSPLLCILGSGGNGASAPVNISITVEQSWPPWDMCCHHSGQAGVWRARPGEAEVPGALSFPEGSGMQKPIDSSGRGAARRSAGTGLGAASCLSASTSHGAAA